MLRPTLKRKMGELTQKITQNLTEVLHRVHFVATTTDCWTVRNKNFLGLTVDWINSDFERESAALACRRLKGSHTFDVLACATDDIHSEYNINDKVIKPTTDNGANFVKAFATFQYKTASTTNVNLCRKVDESSGNVNEQDNSDDDEEDDFPSSMFVEVHFEETDSVLICGNPVCASQYKYQTFDSLQTLKTYEEQKKQPKLQFLSNQTIDPPLVDWYCASI